MDKYIIGNIYTMDRENPFVEAIGIKEGKIAYIGEKSGIEFGHAEVIECTSGAVLPGFMDTHMHPIPPGQFLSGIDVSKYKSISEIIEASKEFAKTVESGKWLFITNFQDKNVTEQRFPTLEELDSISTEHFIMIDHNDLHPFAFNSKVMKKFPLDPTMEGVVLDENGKPTGFVTDPAALEMSADIIDWFTDEEILDGYRNIDEYAVSNGITTVYAKDYYRVIRLLQDNKDKFKTEIKPMLRNRGCMDFESANKLLKDAELREITCLCGFADGAFDGYTGSVIEPYEGRPTDFGMLVQTNDELYNFFLEAHKQGLQLSCHAIGDNAINQILNVYERLLRDYPREDHRHRIEHFEMPTVQAIKKAARLGIALGMQPLLVEVCEGMDMEGYRCFVGNRVKRCSPYRSILDEGLLVGGGSDYSVTVMEPLRSAMICMKHPIESERINLYEALEMFTINAAKIGFLENRKGMFRLGYDADMVILNKNPFATKVDEIGDIKVSATMRNGKIVYTEK